MLFAKLRAIYADRWSNRFSSSDDLELATQEWAKVIGKLSAEQIQQALETCRTEFKFPPTIAEFRQAAQSTKAMHRTNASALALPTKPFAERKTRALAEIEKLKHCLQEDAPKVEPSLPIGCGTDDWFRARGFQQIYKVGEEELKSYIRKRK